MSQQPDEYITLRFCIKKDKFCEFSWQKPIHTKGFQVTFTKTVSILLQPIGEISSEPLEEKGLMSLNYAGRLKTIDYCKVGLLPPLKIA